MIHISSFSDYTLSFDTSQYERTIMFVLPCGPNMVVPISSQVKSKAKKVYHIWSKQIHT